MSMFMSTFEAKSKKPSIFHFSLYSLAFSNCLSYFLKGNHDSVGRNYNQSQKDTDRVDRAARMKRQK